MSKAKPAAKTAKPVEQVAIAVLAPVETAPAVQEQALVTVETAAAAPTPVAVEVVEQPISAPVAEATVFVTSPWGAARGAVPQDGAHTHSIAPQPPAQPVEALDDFLHRIECAHIDRDVYAVAATHPEATARVWPGTYSGIRISQGDVSVTYSDGSQA